MGYANKFAVFKINCIQCKNEFISENWQVERKYCSLKCFGKSKTIVWENIPKERQLYLLKERLERHLIKSDGCWEWTGGSVQQGYGHFQIGKKSFRGSRTSWLVYRGEIPEGMWILHSCDNPSCNNPDHLFMGTAKDNTNDMTKKGRARGRFSKGIIPAITKLKEQQVKEIKQLLKKGVAASELACKYNVHKDTIYAIKIEKNWAHIKE